MDMENKTTLVVMAAGMGSRFGGLKQITPLGPKGEVIVDFSNVTFMDSTGIGVLLGRYNKFRKNNIAIFIKNPQSHVDRIFKMTGIYELMPKIS